MARIIVQAVRRDGKPRRWTLSERVVPQNLADEHYATQLLERLSWATADAEALESHTTDLPADHHDDIPHPARGSVRDRPPRQSLSARLPLSARR